MLSGSLNMLTGDLDMLTAPVSILTSSTNPRRAEKMSRRSQWPLDRRAVPKDGPSLTLIPRHPGAVVALAFAGAANRLVVAHWPLDPKQPSELLVWDPMAGTVTPPEGGRSDRVLDVAATAGAPNWFTAAMDIPEIPIWDAPSGKRAHVLKADDDVVTVSFSLSGARLAAGWRGRPTGGVVRVWDTLKWAAFPDISVPDRALVRVQLSPDGEAVAVAVWGNDPKISSRVRVFEVQTGKLVKDYPAAVGAIGSIAFSPDGRCLAYGGGTHPIPPEEPVGGVRVRNLADDTETVLQGHKGGIWAIQFGPDGRQLAAAGSARTVWLWDVPTCSLGCGECRTDAGSITAIAFSPDGKRLAAGTARPLAHLGIWAEDVGELWVWNVV